jgi:hypothetical protein
MLSGVTRRGKSLHGDTRQRRNRRRHERLARSFSGKYVETFRGQPGHGFTPRCDRAQCPRAKGDPYFVSARYGAEEAAKELGVDLRWGGPASLDAAKQNELIENWITRRVDAIAVAVENKAGISTFCEKLVNSEFR